MEVLRLVETSLNSEAIAGLLNLSLKTVRNIHYAVKAKIGAENDAHLLWLALAAGLIPPTSSRQIKHDAGIFARQPSRTVL
jgi:DNA-binding CsgD family transcriptional regulator